MTTHAQQSADLAISYGYGPGLSEPPQIEVSYHEISETHRAWHGLQSDAKLAVTVDVGTGHVVGIIEVGEGVPCATAVVPLILRTAGCDHPPTYVRSSSQASQVAKRAAAEYLADTAEYLAERMAAGLPVRWPC